MMFCRNCGAGLDDGAKFCRICGAPVSPVAHPAPSVEVSPAEPAPASVAATPTPVSGETPTAPQVSMPEGVPVAPKKRKGKGILIAILIVVALLATAAGGFFIYLSNTYKTADRLFSEGEYAEAAETFERIGFYKDSKERAEDAKLRDAYNEAEQLFKNGKYDAAAKKYRESGSYLDSKQMAVFSDAFALYEKGDLEAVYEIVSNPDFTNGLAPAHADAAEALRVEIEGAMLRAAYSEAETLLAQGNYTAAAERFRDCGSYSDSAKLAAYADAAALYESDDIEGAYKLVSDPVFAVGIGTAHAEEVKQLRVKVTEEYAWLQNVAIVESGTADSDCCDFFFAQYQKTGAQEAYDYLLLSIHYTCAEYCRDNQIALTTVDGFINQYFNGTPEYFEALKNSKYSALTDDPCYEEFKLIGDWRSGDTHFEMLESGQISFNLPYDDFGDYFGIYNGELFFYSTDDDGNEIERRNIFRIQMTSENTINVYCYKDESTYTLNKQG